MWWARILASGPTAQRYVQILTLPIAIVVGGVGYSLEQRFVKPKEITYLNESINDKRLKREMGENFGDASVSTQNLYHLDADHQKLVPNSLRLNS